MREFFDWVTSVAREPDPVAPWTGGLTYDESLRVEDARGIELLNDNDTPMAFVLSMFMQCFGMDVEIAWKATTDP